MLFCCGQWAFGEEYCPDCDNGVICKSVLIISISSVKNAERSRLTIMSTLCRCTRVTNINSNALRNTFKTRYQARNSFSIIDKLIPNGAKKLNQSNSVSLRYLLQREEHSIVDHRSTASQSTIDNLLQKRVQTVINNTEVPLSDKLSKNIVNHCRTNYCYG